MRDTVLKVGVTARILLMAKRTLLTDWTCEEFLPANPLITYRRVQKYFV
jgi:hypothetical protein